MSDKVERCSVCNEELTNYGSKQLKDGILCRNCAKLASSWLEDDDYLLKSVKDMKKHLKYREDNLKKLEGFKPSREVDGKYSLYIDDDNKQFIISKKKDFVKDNADVIDLKDIDEMSVYEQQYLKEDGVDIFFEAKLNNPELNKVHFRVNEFPGINQKTDEYKQASEIAVKYIDALMDKDFEEVE